ncbi:serine/arginine repetitive matrix protein 2-like [Gigantopelta aegis]|uniref:serine/arginine repetitive matrix protein 2-like n=1 Tax=Gigantopelta aegis TaxID=1735272 RepID=UPI001B889CEB|nr:serine/arginine repetitive matrix protein 2-like [Gigantopelta aegis]XP_041363367.1 serine/arginine repetitive matrix protein 2-like [Gigantopelta aegis]
MSRYDVDKFNPTPDPDLVCCICTCILDKPLVSPCQHVFCKVCIQTWLDRKKTCPTCRTRLTKDELRPVLPLVRNMLNRLTMVCDFKENGCDHVLNMEQFDGHIRECEFEMVTCRYDRCLKRLLKRDIRSHEDEDCDFKEITCSSCQLDVPVKEMHVHDCVVALKTCLKGLKKTIEELNKVLKASKEEVSNLTKKLEEQRWHALDDSWDSSSSWQSWDSHTDLSGSYTYSDDDRSINAEDNSPFQHLHLLPSASPSFMFHASDPLGLNSSFTPTTRSNTLNRDVFDVGLPSISVSTSTTVLPSFTNTRVMTSHSQDDTLSASENSDNSNRHRRRQNQRLVSERPHTDTSQGRSFLDVYTSFGTAVEEAFRNSAQSVPQSRHPQESVNEAWNAPSAPRGTILTFGSSAGVEHTIFKSNPSSPVEHSVYISPFRVHHSRSRSRSSERSRNSLNRHYFSRSSDRTSRRRSRSDERSVSSRSVSSESDARSRAESDRSRSLEHSFHSGTKSSENGDRSRSMSCSTQSSDYFSRSKSRSYERSTRSRSESYEHSARSRSESSERSVRSRSKRSERSTRSRSKSSEHSWSRSSQHSVRSWLQSLKNRSRSRSSECSDKSLSRQSDTRSGSRLSEHSGRNMYRSSHRRRSRSRSEDSDRRRSWLSENSNLSDNTSNRSLSSRLSHRKLYRSHYSRSRSRSQYSGRTKSLSEYSSRSRSECDNSSKFKSRSFHSEHSAKRRSRSPDKRRRISRTVLDSSSSESSSNGSRLSSKCFKKRFRSALRRDSRNWKSASDVKSNSSNNSRSEKKPYRSEKRGCSSSSSDNSTVVGSSLSPNVGSGGARQNLETLKSTKQQSVLPFLKTSLSELANCLLKNCPSSQNSNKSARKVLPSNSKKKSARNVTNVITDTNNISDNDSVNTNRNLPGISAVLTTAGLIENSHPATVTSTTEPLHSNINCGKKKFIVCQKFTSCAKKY